MVVGTLGIAQTLDHPDRRHRPLGRRDHGAVVDRDGQAVAPTRACPGLLALLLGFARRHGLRAASTALLVTRLKLPPFIVTLGTLNVFFALNLWYSESETIRGTDMSSLLLWTGKTIDIGDTRITYGSILMLVLFAVFAWVLKNTAWGRHVYAVGDDAEAARLAGVRKDRVLLSVYVVAGLICAVAGWMLIGRIASASPQAGGSANLDSITAVVIGGTSLFGGRGRVIGTLFGALIVGVLRNGLDAGRRRRALAGLRRRHPDHRRRRHRPVDPEGEGMTATDDPDPRGPRPGQALRPRHRAGRLGLRAAARARSWPSSATTAPASRR